MKTTAELEEREPDVDLDGCSECGNDSWREVKSNYYCAVCGCPYADSLGD